MTYDPKPETPILCPQCDHDIARHDRYGCIGEWAVSGDPVCFDCDLSPADIARALLRHDTSHRPLAPIPGAIYLAGPMSGVPNNNYPAFHAAAARLRAEGHDVLSPAEHTETADSWAGWMRLGIAMLIQCDTIVLLPGWQESRGAKIEAKLAADLGMSTMEFGAKANR